MSLKLSRKIKKGGTKKYKDIKKHKIQLHSNSCNPAKSGSENYSCFNRDALIKLRDLWNTKHPDSKITSNVPFDIWNMLRSKFSNVCSSEKCWLKQQFFKNNLGSEILDYTFAPSAPSTWKNDKNTWLNSDDITKVMKQYEHEYPNFNFIGPTPMDFDTKLHYGDCVWEELCRFNLKALLKKRIQKIGIIFNTDNHDKGGSHWVSAFIDTSANPTPYFFYFDSNGDKVTSEIKKLADKVISQAKKLGIDMIYRDNHNVEHQLKDTECGIYSLYLISELLTGNKTYDFFMNNIIRDDEMEKFRKVFFNLK